MKHPLSILSKQLCQAVKLPVTGKGETKFPLLKKNKRKTEGTQASQSHLFAWQGNGGDPPGNYAKVYGKQGGDC